MKVDRTCSARQHLSLEEWGLLEDCTRVTRGGKNPFFLDGRAVASRFCRTNKNTVYRVVKLLESNGWLVKIGGGSRNKKTGMYAPTQYRIVSHEEWVKGDGRSCPDFMTGPVLESGQAPVPISNTTSPDCPIPPVPKSGHSSVKSFCSTASVGGIPLTGAKLILQTSGLPQTAGNLRTVTLSIEAIAIHGSGKAKASDWLLSRVKSAMQYEKITKFWFEDARYAEAADYAPGGMLSDRTSDVSTQPKRCSTCGDSQFIHQAPSVPGPRLVPCPDCTNQSAVVEASL